MGKGARILAVLTVLVVLGLGVFGAVYRTSYTDIAAQPDYLSLLQVAEMPESVVQTACTGLRETLPSMPFVLRVSAVDVIEYMFSIGRQKVKVEEIYNGSGIEIGDEIYLISSSWSLSEVKYVECGFVNIMKPGNEYLVFISEKVDALKEETPVYRIYDRFFISPLFCYSDDFSRVVISVVDVLTYVPYKELQENEFFATTEETMQTIYALKEEMLSMYPVGSSGAIPS